MCGHCIIGDTSAFFTQMEITFAYFEKNFDIPSFSVDAEDVYKRQVFSCRIPESNWRSRMEKPDGKSTSGRTEKQLAVY